MGADFTLATFPYFDMTDDRRERFVSLFHDIDVQRLTFEAYMNKKLVKSRPMAHLKIGIKNLAHLTGIVSAEHV